MHLARFLGIAAATFAFTAALPAAAAPVVDQSFATTDDPDHNTGLGIVSTSLGQSFTVGLTGTLAGVEFSIFKFRGTTGDLTVDIRSVTGAGPSASAGSALATASVANAAIVFESSSPYAYSTIYVDFSAAGLHVMAGDILSFVLSSPISEQFAVQTDYLDAYAGGERWSQDGDGNPFSANSSADLSFRTFVSVPEPGTTTLLGLSLAGLVAFRRRRP